MLVALGLLNAIYAEDVPAKKIKTPIRLISHGENKTAGNYRVIPLEDSTDASLSDRTSDVLQRQTGVEVNRAGAPGTQSILGIRGSNPDQVEFFLEGVPLPKPYNAPLNLEILPLALFQSVDIFPSFVPSHLPATNFGGAMDFRVRRSKGDTPEYLTELRLTSLLGSSLSLARVSRLGLHFASAENSQNYYRYKSDNGTSENLADDKILYRTNEDFSRFGYTGFMDAKIHAWTIKALLDISHANRGLPGVASAPLSAVRKVDTRASVALTLERKIGDAQKLSSFVSTTLEKTRIDDPKTELFFSRSQESFAPQALAGVSYAIGLESFDASFNIRGSTQFLFLNENKIAERKRADAATSFSYDIRYVRLAAQGGLSANEDNASAGAFYGTGDKYFYGTGLNASGIFTLRPLACLSFFQNKNFSDEILELYAQASSAYRDPSLYERFGDNVFVTASEKLKSENAITNAAGVKSSFGCVWGFTCSLRSEGYVTGAHDYIIFTQNSSRTLIAVNASSAQIWGVENELLFDKPEVFMFSLRYSYLDAKDYGKIPYYQDKYLPFRPRHHAYISAAWTYRSLRFLASLDYRGAVFRDRYNSYAYYLPSKTLVDLGVEYSFVRAAKHTLTFTAKNIFDNTEVDLIGYTVPGRYFVFKWMATW
ncbi:MAG: Vitamin B12 transporter BtuB [Turneriella sp.]|nr:Vitamin B12 transporter BtuB [Turneriella sp.]